MSSEYDYDAGFIGGLRFAHTLCCNVINLEDLGEDREFVERAIERGGDGEACADLIDRWIHRHDLAFSKSGSGR